MNIFYHPKFGKSHKLLFWKLLLILLLLGALLLPLMIQYGSRLPSLLQGTEQMPTEPSMEAATVPSAPTEPSVEAVTIPSEPTAPVETDAPQTVPPVTESATLPQETIPETLPQDTAAAPEPTEIQADAHQHSFEPSYTQDPTCIEDGYTLYTCDCGETRREDPVAALGHDYEETVLEAEGKAVYVCTRCGDSYQKELPASAVHTHSFHPVEAVEPTCSTVGYTLYRCSCGLSQKEDIVPALGHSYEITVIAPASGQQGYTLHQCTRCADFYRTNFEKPLP